MDTGPFTGKNIGWAYPWNPSIVGSVEWQIEETARNLLFDYPALCLPRSRILEVERKGSAYRTTFYEDSRGSVMAWDFRACEEL